MLRSKQTEEAEAVTPHKLSAGEIYSVVSRKILTEYATITFDDADGLDPALNCTEILK